MKLKNSINLNGYFLKVFGLFPVFLVMVSCILVTGCSKQKSQIPFESEKWISSEFTERYRMVDDLEENFNIIGMSLDEVKDVLGAPDLNYDPDGDNTNSNFYVGYGIRNDEINGEEILLLKFEDSKMESFEKAYLGDL